MVFGGERPEMTKHVLAELLLPFVGTSLGAGCVFFLKKGLDLMVRRALTGFAAGVMVAASVWSLLVPAMEQAAVHADGSLSPGLQGVEEFFHGDIIALVRVFGDTVDNVGDDAYHDGDEDGDGGGGLHGALAGGHQPDQHHQRQQQQMHQRPQPGVCNRPDAEKDAGKDEVGVPDISGTAGGNSSFMAAPPPDPDHH